MLLLIICLNPQNPHPPLFFILPAGLWWPTNMGSKHLPVSSQFPYKAGWSSQAKSSQLIIFQVLGAVFDVNKHPLLSNPSTGVPKSFSIKSAAWQPLSKSLLLWWNIILCPKVLRLIVLPFSSRYGLWMAPFEPFPSITFSEIVHVPFPFSVAIWKPPQ